MWIDDRGSEVLSLGECRRLLAVGAKTGLHGHLGIAKEGAPLILPVDFTTDGSDVVVRVGDHVFGQIEGALVVLPGGQRRLGRPRGVGGTLERARPGVRGRPPGAVEGRRPAASACRRARTASGPHPGRRGHRPAVAPTDTSRDRTGVIRAGRGGPDRLRRLALRSRRCGDRHGARPRRRLEGGVRPLPRRGGGRGPGSRRRRSTPWRTTSASSTAGHGPTGCGPSWSRGGSVPRRAVPVTPRRPARSPASPTARTSSCTGCSMPRVSTSTTAPSPSSRCSGPMRS